MRDKEKTRIIFKDKNGKKMFIRKQYLPSKVFSLYHEEGFKMNMAYVPIILQNIKKAIKELYVGDGKFRMGEKPELILKFPCIACGHINELTFTEFKLGNLNCKACGIVYTCGTQYA